MVDNNIEVYNRYNVLIDIIESINAFKDGITIDNIKIAKDGLDKVNVALDKSILNNPELNKHYTDIIMSNLNEKFEEHRTELVALQFPTIDTFISNTERYSEFVKGLRLKLASNPNDMNVTLDLTRLLQRYVIIKKKHKSITIPNVANRLITYSMEINEDKIGLAMKDIKGHVMRVDHNIKYGLVYEKEVHPNELDIETEYVMSKETGEQLLNAFEFILNYVENMTSMNDFKEYIMTLISTDDISRTLLLSKYIGYHMLNLDYFYRRLLGQLETLNIMFEFEDGRPVN